MYFKTVLTPSVLFAVVSLLVGNAEYSLASVVGNPNWSDTELNLQALIREYLPDEPLYTTSILWHRFARSSEYNLEKAKDKWEQYVEWRKAENIDSILEENWTDMDDIYPYRKSIYDEPGAGKDYRALILSIDLGKWDMRVAANAIPAEQKRFVRFVTGKMMEDVNRNSRPGTVVGGRTAYPDTVQFEIVVNMKDYELRKHACLQCTRFLMEIIDEVGTHWSEAVGRIYLANAPDFHPHVHSWIEDFQRRFGIPVEIRPGQVLLSRNNGKYDKVDSLVVFRDWVWTIEE